MKTTEGLDILHRLLDRADVLVSNLAPGSTGRLGITPADMEVRHPNVIAVEIDGYGPGGPLSHKRAYDLLIQAESGTCAVTGEAGAPAKPGPPVADITTGLRTQVRPELGDVHADGRPIACGLPWSWSPLRRMNVMALVFSRQPSTVRTYVSR